MLPENLAELARPFHELNRPMLVWTKPYTIMIYKDGIIVASNKTQSVSATVGHKIAERIGLHDYAVALHKNKLVIIPTGGSNVLQS